MFPQVDLVLTGVDTVADIAHNGAVIARAENAHREHRLSVKPLLKEGANALRLTILPAVLEAFAKNATYPYPAPILTYQVIAPYNFLRKPASDGAVRGRRPGRLLGRRPGRRVRAPGPQGRRGRRPHL